MPMFRYTAKDKGGRPMGGLIEALDAKTLSVSLRGQGLTIISVREEKVKEPGSSSGFSFGKPKIKSGELVVFSRQLATMIEAGIPLVQALEILGEQIETPLFKKVVQEVKRDVTSGLAFHEALAKHKNAFSPLFINMAKAGEAAGALDEIMDRLATYMEKADSLQHKVRSAMNYPIVVSSMAVLITILMLVKVVPVFKQMFADFDAKLPLPTLVLVSISEFLIKTLPFWIVGFVVAVVLFQRFIKTVKGRLLWHTFLFKMPIFGVILRKTAVAKFTRTLATLLKSGVPILQALDIVGKSSDNSLIENAVEYVRISIRGGENITDPLLKTKVFPPLVVRMIAVGEQTGELEKMLNKIADFYDDQVNSAVAGLTSLIEPLIIAFLGVVIGGIVICMFLPIFKLASVVTGK